MLLCRPGKLVYHVLHTLTTLRLPNKTCLDTCSAGGWSVPFWVGIATEACPQRSGDLHLDFTMFLLDRSGCGNYIQVGNVFKTVYSLQSWEKQHTRSKDSSMSWEPSDTSSTVDVTWRNSTWRGRRHSGHRWIVWRVLSSCNLHFHRWGLQKLLI